MSKKKMRIRLFSRWINDSGMGITEMRMNWKFECE